jgi:hypothetical protein
MKHIDAAQGRTQIEKARQIMGSLGVRYAAGYLRNRGWSLDGALFVLLATSQRFEQVAP